MTPKENTLTGRWFIDDGRPLASGEHTQELRVLDMLPGSDLDRKLVEVDGLRYSAVSLRGARILAQDPNAYDDDGPLPVAPAAEDGGGDPTPEPSFTAGADESAEIVLPENGFGRLLRRTRARAELAAGTLGTFAARIQAADTRGLAERLVRVAQERRFNAAIAGAIALAVVGVGGVALAAASGGEEPATPLAAQHRALQRLARDFALRAPAAADPGRLTGSAADPGTAAGPGSIEAPAGAEGADPDMVFSESDVSTPQIAQGTEEPERRAVRRRGARRHRWSRRM